MELKDILAISGQPGLFKFISKGRNSVIVEPLEGGKRMNAHASLKVLALEDIQIFTTSDEVPLSKVFSLIYEKENGGEAISHKSSPEELKAYMAEVMPGYDKERVYVSDIKKIIHWYNILHSLEMLRPEEEEKEAGKTGEEQDSKNSSDEKDDKHDDGRKDVNEGSDPENEK